MNPLESTKSKSEKILCYQKMVNELQEKSKRPVCYLSFSQQAFSITDSHLGGVPYLPHHQEYPVGTNGERLWLCAQINFAQMPVLDGFPQEGILQFFLSDWDYDAGFGLYSEDVVAMKQDSWRILYHPFIDESVTKEECKQKMPILQEKEELWITPNRPLKMTFSSIKEEGMDNTDYRFEQFNQQFEEEITFFEEDEYTEEEKQMIENIHEKINIGGCKVGGSPRYMQEDPRYYSQECGKPLEEWDTLLFQLDDDTFTFPAGDVGEMNFNLNGGTLNFLIRDEDLKNRDFSQVLAQWACT